MKYTAVVVAVLIVLAALLVARGGLFHSWKYNQTVDGIEYKRMRFEEIRGEQGTSFHRLSRKNKSRSTS